MRLLPREPLGRLGSCREANIEKQRLERGEVLRDGGVVRQKRIVWLAEGLVIELSRQIVNEFGALLEEQFQGAVALG